MTKHKIIAPFNQHLLEKLKEVTTIVRTDNPDAVEDIMLHGSRVTFLESVWLQMPVSLKEVPFRENWNQKELILDIKRIGVFREIADVLGILRKLKVTVLVPSVDDQTMTQIKILASLGINCGVKFSQHNDWNTWSELMHYAVYTKVHHGDVQPFAHYLKNYHPTQATSPDTPFFNNPNKYLYLDEDENIALSLDDLNAKNFIAQGIDALDTITESQLFIDRINTWQSHFLQTEGCAYCPAWRACLGKFADTAKENPECQNFFKELMDAIETVKPELTIHN